MDYTKRKLSQAWVRIWFFGELAETDQDLIVAFVDQWNGSHMVDDHDHM